MAREVFLHTVIVSVSKTAAYSEPFSVSEQLEGSKRIHITFYIAVQTCKGESVQNWRKYNIYADTAYEWRAVFHIRLCNPPLPWL